MSTSNHKSYTPTASESIPKMVDMEKIIASKNPAILKWTPRFIINYIKRVIHQDEVNYVLHTYGHLRGLAFNDAIIKEHWHSWYQAHGLENVPTGRRYIFASNHPLGAFDGLILMSAIGARFPELRFIVNDLLLYLKPFDPLFIPVNKHGRQSAAYANQIEATYASDRQVLYFPAGLCSRRYNGRITDPPWHPAFIRKAVQYKRDVVPVFFEGRNSNRFYRIESIRKRLGIKLNIGMFCLPDEFFRQKNRLFNLYFGDPIPCETFDKSRTAAQWTQVVRDAVYGLKEERRQEPDREKEQACVRQTENDREAPTNRR
ncbi:MAG: 1-acyl-sn-glycerol-3-phosphate acyltransferase [Prevotellaceae bacterium]|nr:1-acyl-sn-glycerol-3-phosphate acyltransferase [Prevotellaceae bacterium]